MCFLFPIFGGNWNNGSNAGVFARNFNNNRSNSNYNVGFRVSDYISLPENLVQAYWKNRGTSILQFGKLSIGIYLSSRGENLYA